MLDRLFFWREKEEPIDGQISAVLNEMDDANTLSDDYPKLLGYLERLTKVKAGNKPSPVSRDTIILVLGNLAGVLIIVAYEQKHVLTSKGFNQLIRLKSTND